MVGESLNTTAADLEGVPQVRQDGRIPVMPEMRKNRWMIMMSTVGMFLAFRNCFVGFLAGCMCWALLEVQDRMASWGNESVYSEEEERPLLLP